METDQSQHNELNARYNIGSSHNRPTELSTQPIVNTDAYQGFEPYSKPSNNWQVNQSPASRPDSDTDQVTPPVYRNQAAEPSRDHVPDFLQDLLKRSSVHLSSEEESQLAELLVKYQQVFAKSSSDLGCCERVNHRINTVGAVPVRQPARRLPFGKQQIEQTEISKMLERGVIEPSKSGWSSPVVLVTKKDVTIRFCVDYRVLNDRTVKDAYPIPRVDDCLDTLSGSKWYSSMDLN